MALVCKDCKSSDIYSYNREWSEETEKMQGVYYCKSCGEKNSLKIVINEIQRINRNKRKFNNSITK